MLCIFMRLWTCTRKLCVIKPTVCDVPADRLVIHAAIFLTLNNVMTVFCAYPLQRLQYSIIIILSLHVDFMRLWTCTRKLCVIKPTVFDVLADRLVILFLLLNNVCVCVINSWQLLYNYILYSGGMSSTGTHSKRSYYIWYDCSF